MFAGLDAARVPDQVWRSNASALASALLRERRLHQFLLELVDLAASCPPPSAPDGAPAPSGGGPADACADDEQFQLAATALAYALDFAVYGAGAPRAESDDRSAASAAGGGTSVAAALLPLRALLPALGLRVSRSPRLRRWLIDQVG